jgi:hypothetical protein
MGEVRALSRIQQAVAVCWCHTRGPLSHGRDILKKLMNGYDVLQSAMPSKLLCNGPSLFTSLANAFHEEHRPLK